MHLHFATIEKDGWTLESSEERNAQSPETFSIPSRAERESLSPGDGAKLLFDIETREAGQVVDRGTDRMWVIVKTKADGLYVRILDSDPGVAARLTFPRFQRHLYKEEQDEIGGQHDHQDTTAIHGRI